MTNLMQGTTPSVTITIDTDDFLLSNVTEIDLKVQNGSTVTSYTIEDLTVDTSENTVTKAFTEDETTAMSPNNSIVIQARFFLADGSIIGINPLRYGVADFIGL